MSAHRKNQCAKYRDRYGPGLIIYWFGFLEDESEGATVEVWRAKEQLLVLAGLPQTFVIRTDLKGKYGKLHE
jgi:hypothetical protein